MISYYLNYLPYKFIKTIASYLPLMGSFEIYRAQILPPEPLESIIWPELDQFYSWFSPGPDQIDDLATAGTINLLVYL